MCLETPLVTIPKHLWACGYCWGLSLTIVPLQIGTGFTEESLEKHYNFLKVKCWSCNTLETTWAVW